MYPSAREHFHHWYHTYNEQRRPEHLNRMLGLDLDQYYMVASLHWFGDEAVHPFPTRQAAERFYLTVETERARLLDPQGNILEERYPKEEAK